MTVKLPYMNEIFHIWRLYNKGLMPFAAESGLAKGQGQTMILDALAHKDGCIQRELAERSGHEPATITTALSDMEQKGLIERRGRPNDRRIYAIYLTESGKRVSDRVLGEFNRFCEETVLDGFTDKEKAQLLSYLERMHYNLAGRDVN